MVKIGLQVGSTMIALSQILNGACDELYPGLSDTLKYFISNDDVVNEINDISESLTVAQIAFESYFGVEESPTVEISNEAFFIVTSLIAQLSNIDMGRGGYATNEAKTFHKAITEYGTTFFTDLYAYALERQARMIEGESILNFKFEKPSGVKDEPKLFVMGDDEIYAPEQEIKIIH